jgi:hypothetical protein
VEKLKSFSLKLGTRVSTCHIVIHYSTGTLIQSNKSRERNKRNSNIELSLFSDKIPYIKDFKDATKKLLDLINTFDKVAVYKINIQISRFYINQQCTVRERNWEKIHSQ